MSAGKNHKLLRAGARVAGFSLPLVQGGEATFENIAADGHAVLAFFKVSCPVCQMTFPFLDRIHASGKLPVYGVSQNNASDTREFLRRFGITLPVLLDSSQGSYAVSNAFGISTVPTMFLVDAGGSIARVLEGWRKSEIAELGALAGVNPFRPDDSVPEAKAG